MFSNIRKNIVILLFKIALITSCFSASYAKSVNALKADITVNNSINRFYLRLSDKPTKHHINFLTNPHRLVIDIKGMNWKAEPFHKKGVIKNVRFGKRPNNYGRVVLDIKQKMHLSHFEIKPHPRYKNLWLMVVELLDGYNKEIEVVKPKKGKTNKAKKNNFKFTSKHKFKPIRKNLNDILVIIDPGHGGNDPGAISVNKRKEKDIVLRFSRELASKINRTYGMKAILTRDDDFYIPLKERVALARYYQADLFISIHADALHDPNMQGATIYTLSDKASDDLAAQLAIKENNSDVVAGVNIEEAKNEEVSDILVDLLQRETDSYSYDLAEYMVKQLKTVTTMMRKPHRQAGFAVLKAPDIPSILVELGYLTNYKDEKRLMDRRWRINMIKQMIQSVKIWNNERRKSLI